jgi:hypothetical protein
MAFIRDLANTTIYNVYMKWCVRGMHEMMCGVCGGVSAEE